jgi:GTP cyclohydrolase I
VQERLTKQIGLARRSLQPKGVGVVIEARHVHGAVLAPNPTP